MAGGRAEPEKCLVFFATIKPRSQLRLLHCPFQEGTCNYFCFPSNTTTSSQSFYPQRLLQRRYNVNAALVSAGLGAICDVEGLHNNAQYLSFVKELNRKELVAKKKGRGMWAGTKYESWWNRIRRRITR